MKKSQKEKTKKVIQFSVVAIFVLSGLVYFFPRSADTAKKIVLTLDFGDSQKSYQTFLKEENRAWSLLQQVAAISGTNLEAGENFSVKRIDGKQNGDGNKNWSFYVNGKKEKRSPYEVMVKAPAKVTFKFE
ncbi:MAG: hypothetical protein L6Q29_00935 [Candidatus Pacebacteria bacterium]|nr:hypothetical protein [Candidatus Paceibacterota bacterium]NUQ57152.1 hypothetical protein [Candidatus Paceibacter sp.]